MFYLVKFHLFHLIKNCVQCFKIFGKACAQQPTKQSVAKLATTLPTLAYIAKDY